MSQLAVTLSGIRYTYEGAESPVLNDLSLQITAGEWVHICGPGGSGKSTLAALLAGLIPRVMGGLLEGKANVLGVDPSTAAIADTTARIAVVFQDPDAQLVQGVVEEEVAFGPENLAVRPEEIRRRVTQVLEDTRLLDLRSSQIHQLSGGQRQRTGIAAALALATPVLVLDEADASLDAAGRELLHALLARMQEKGGTIITLSSRLGPAARMAGRLIVLAGGAVALSGPPAELMGSAAGLLAQLGVLPPSAVPQTAPPLAPDGAPSAPSAHKASASPKAPPSVPPLPNGAPSAPSALDASASTKARSSVPQTPSGAPSLLSAHGAGTSHVVPSSVPNTGTAVEVLPASTSGQQAGAPGRIAASFAPSTRPIAAEPAATVRPLLRLNGLSYTYRRSGGKALDDVSLQLAAGEWGLLCGPNGSGKTTLSKLLMGLLRPPKGMAFLDGEDVSALKTGQLAQQIGYVFQEPEHQFVAGNVREEMLFGPRALLGRRERKLDLPAAVQERADRLLKEAGLIAKQQESPYLLSGGEKRLLGVSCQFMTPKRLYILDEPTAGLDYAAADLLVRLCRGAAAEGAALLMITHEPELFGRWPDVIFTLRHGKLVPGDE